MESTAFTEEVVIETLEQHNNKHYSKNLFYTLAQIWNKIKKLYNKKAPGLDDISNS